jgi:omega-3 fatty acid desaturase (delta-15 desaturase)
MSRTETAVAARSSASAGECANLREPSKVVDPSADLPFNLSTLKAAIPAHCFVKSTWTGLYYLARDFAFIGACYAAYPLVNKYGDAFGLAKFAWWNIVGFFGWCLFVVGHDCGHRTFSDNLMVNDIFGHIAHTPLLVPFHGWRVSHRKHHENHNNVEHDHSWRPTTETTYLQYLAQTTQARISRVVRFSHALLVLFPIYLLMDSDFTSGNHFNPYGRLFDKEERIGAWCSTLSIIAWLVFLVSTFPLGLLLDAYVMPYVFFIIWLDLVTYLHHTDPELTYYRGTAWSFLKGALSTMDRSYGRLIDHLHHDIGTHMVHHMYFTRIPHYHLVEATEALKPILGDHYKLDTTPIVTAYVKSKEQCHWVDDQGAVLKYHGSEEAGKTQ